MAKNKYNCPNCGAVRTGNICEYCGTVFDTDKSIGEIKKDGYFVDLKLDGETIKTYITDAQIIYNRLYTDTGRRMDGTLCISKPITKRQIELKLTEV